MAKILLSRLTTSEYGRFERTYENEWKNIQKKMVNYSTRHNFISLNLKVIFNFIYKKRNTEEHPE